MIRNPSAIAPSAAHPKQKGAAMASPITGFKVLMFAVAAFGTIIAVNVFMAYKAVSTFPGLEVANSYVASQTFDADRAAQEALGWKVAQAYDGQNLTLQIRDAEGRPAWLRATGPGAVDQETADSYVARQVQRDPDLWVVEFDAPDLQPPFEARIV